MAHGLGHDLTGRRLSASTPGASPGMYSLECHEGADWLLGSGFRWKSPVVAMPCAERIGLSSLTDHRRSNDEVDGRRVQ